MRYFRTFYKTEDSSFSHRVLQPIHDQFDDKVFVLPFYRRGCWEDDKSEAFCVTLISKSGSMNAHEAQKCFDMAINTWGLSDLEQTRLEECTLEECFMDCIRSYSDCGFNEQSVRQQLNLMHTYKFISRSSFGMREMIVERPLDREAARERASQTAYTESLNGELDRIFTTVNPSEDDQVFAPICYIVEGNAPSDAEETIAILLGAMKAAGRLESGHVFMLDIDGYMRWPSYDSHEDRNMFLSHQLIRAIEGNTLIVRYGIHESAGEFDITAYQYFTRLLELLEDARCATQVIFSVPERKNDLVRRLRNRFNKPIVIVAKDMGTSLGAESFECNLEAMKDLAAERGLKADDSMRTLLSKRMRANQSVELETVFEEWATYQVAREKYPQYASVIEEAINLDGDDSCMGAQERLDSLIGLDSVKEHVNNIILRVEMGKRLMERGLPREPFSMHMAFVGAPGTGKTEVARLYAEILKDKGILSEGRLITVSGSAGFSVKKAFEAAKGSVLFIDEAYGLLGHNGLVTELIAEMENNRSDTIVILAGYEGHMNALLDCNPGFRSRVQTIVSFPDYTAEELRQIFMFMCERQQVMLDEGVEEMIRDTLERGGKRSDQGNARFVRKIFEDAIGEQQVRLAKHLKDDENAQVTLEELQTLILQDVERAVTSMGFVRKTYDATGREELEALIGLDEVKSFVSARMDFAKMQKVKRDAGMDAPFIPMHMAFKGNPGTGKTEVARLIGRILHEEGVLSVGDFYECGRQDLVSPIVGATASMVESLFRKARGSVIFIDEAYSLIDGGKGGPGDEAINALIDQMEKLRDEVVVILAGYTKEIDDLLSINPGFKSRVKTQIEFSDYGAVELVEILHHMADKQGYLLAEGVEEKVRCIVEKASRTSEFGNARFVRNLLENALVEQSSRLAKKMRDVVDDDGSPVALDVEELSTLVPEDFVWSEPEAAGRVIGFAA